MYELSLCIIFQSSRKSLSLSLSLYIYIYLLQQWIVHAQVARQRKVLSFNLSIDLMQNPPFRQRSSSFEEQSLNNSSIMLSSPASSSSSSSLSGDHIGQESCADLWDNEEELSSGNGGGGGVERRGRIGRSSEMKTKKEFPPPIPWLAQTENLLSHMPWVMKRYHTSDGRLIIREEKVKHHEYFRAHRANGRLTLHLIPMNDDFYDEKNLKGEAEEDEGNAEVGDADDGRGEEEEEEEKESVKSSCVEMNDGGGGGGGGGAAKCYMGSVSSCMFGMAIAAVKPLHI